MKFEIVNLQNADVRKNRKENHFYKEDAVMTIIDGRIQCKFIVRYYATSKTHYCCIWLTLPKTAYIHSSGWAGGYGYHRESAALNDALKNCGIEFYNLAGTGQGEEALKMLFKHFYPDLTCMIHTAHA
jgi:hypothetical protein